MYGSGMSTLIIIWNEHIVVLYWDIIGIDEDRSRGLLLLYYSKTDNLIISL